MLIFREENEGLNVLKFVSNFGWLVGFQEHNSKLTFQDGPKYKLMQIYNVHEYMLILKFNEG